MLGTGSNSCFYDGQYIIEEFESWTPERADVIIEKIYNLEKPNLYLAYFFRFMYENKQEVIFDTIFRNGIQQFFDIHIKCFDNYKKYPLTFVGSVAFYCKTIYMRLLKRKKFRFKKSYNPLLKI